MLKSLGLLFFFLSLLSEAKAIESVLDRNGIDYTFEIVEYSGRSVLSILFGGVKKK